MIDSPMDPLVIETCLNGLHDLSGFGSIKLDELRHGYAVFHFDASLEMRNVNGNVHGGFIMAVGDITAAAAACSCGSRNVTLQGNFNFCKGIRVNGQRVLIEAKVVHEGRTTSVVELVFINETGDICVKASFTTFSKGRICPKNRCLTHEESLDIAYGNFAEAGREPF